MSGDVSQLQRLAFEIANEKGWHDEPRTVGDRIALMHSELSEALEDFRSGHETDEVYYESGISSKPCGIGIELADCVIRIFDFCEEESIHLDDLILLKMNFNRTRPRRHGGKVL